MPCTGRERCPKKFNRFNAQEGKDKKITRTEGGKGVILCNTSPGNLFQVDADEVQEEESES